MHMRSINKNRSVRKMGKISESDLVLVRKGIKEVLVMD